MKMKIGYIRENDLKLNPHLTERFQFKEATFTRRISNRGDRVYSKMLLYPVDYEEIVSNAKIMRDNPFVILVREPFLLDDELREKVTKWVEWANNADPSEEAKILRNIVCLRSGLRLRSQDNTLTNKGRNGRTNESCEDN